MINVVTIRSSDVLFDLAVVEDGEKISVAKGDIRLSDGTTVQLADDFEHRLAARSVMTDVEGYIVRNRRTGEYEIFVDEVEANKVDVPHDFSTGDYELVGSLFWGVVPANVASFASVKVQVNRMVPRAAPAPHPPRAEEKERAVVEARARSKAAAGN